VAPYSLARVRTRPVTPARNGVRKQQAFHRLLHGIGCYCQESAHLFFCIRGSVSWAKYTVLISSWSVHKRQSSTVVALNQFRRWPTGVGNQISTRQSAFRRRPQTARLRRVADIHRLPENFAACRRLNSTSCGLQVHRSACANGNFRTFASQFLRHRTSQPLARRSHNRHAPRNPRSIPGLQVQSFMFSRRRRPVKSALLP